MEENEQQETPQEIPKDETGVSIVEEARAIRDEIVKAKEDLKTENDRKADLMAKDMLGGRSQMGEPKEEPKEQSAGDYMKDVMAGKTDDK